MRRPLSGLIVLAVLSASGTAAASPGGPEPYGFGGRVVASDAGFAVTLPDDWLWLRRAADGLESLDAVIDDPATDPRLSSDLWAMRQQGLEEQADLIVSRGIDRVTAAGQTRFYEPMCTFTKSPTDDWTLRDGVEDTLAAFDYPMVSEPLTRWLKIAGTQAVRVSIGPPMLLDDPDFATAAAVVYWLGDGNRLYHVDCGSSNAPADLWQSVIETWEWLPDDASGVLGPSSSVRSSPAHGWRLEAEEGGFAMDLPDRWWPSYSHGVVGGTWANMAASVLDGPLTRWVALVGPSSGCGVLTGAIEVDTAETALAGLDVDDAASVDLPAGPALRVGPTRVGPTGGPLDDDTDSYGQAAYVITSSSRLAIIECAGLVPDDRWLPVAEAFMFLSREE